MISPDYIFMCTINIVKKNSLLILTDCDNFSKILKTRIIIDVNLIN